MSKWHVYDLNKIYKMLRCDPQGLPSDEAKSRLEQYGYNKLPQAKPRTILQFFFLQFRSPLIYLLLAATAISLLINEPYDALFIFIVLIFNAIMGTIQEWQAQTNALNLVKLVPKHATVLRDGTWSEIDAENLVPGDIVQLSSGLHVSADLRLITAQELQIDESLLTGESVAVNKDPKALLEENSPTSECHNMLFAGTTIITGRATGIVVETGSNTKIGEIAQTLAYEEGQPPPLVAQLNRFVGRIGWASIILICLIASAQILQDIPLITVLLVSIALAVAAIPEGLPVAITIALTIATKRMQENKVIVRSLPAVEGLGACTMIASDKTGTLTINEMTAQIALLFKDNYPIEKVRLDQQNSDEETQARIQDLARTSVLCSEATEREENGEILFLGDTVDIAFLKLAKIQNLNAQILRDNVEEISSIPYEPERGFTATFLHPKNISQNSSQKIEIHMKGAVEKIAARCPNLDQDLLNQHVDTLAADGYRVLAIAKGETTQENAQNCNLDHIENFQLLGLIGMIDPIREEVTDAIDECRQAGIHVTMVTGDHPTTALAIARQLNIAQSQNEVGTGIALREIIDDPKAIDQYVANKSVFARVEPLHKLQIVQSFQRLGHVVAVTGDGVNDAPALKTADIGVAMGKGGTDVARSAADLILTDDNFTSIVAGIREGRISYSNIRKLIYLLISTGLAEIILFILSILFALPIPLFAVQLLWLNLVTNGIQDIALSFEKGAPDITKRKPRPKSEKLFNSSMVKQVFTAGTFMGVMSFGAFYGLLQMGIEENKARNLLLLLMVLFENAHALNARSEHRSILTIPFSANWFLIVAVALAHILHIAAMYIPSLASILRIQPVTFYEWSITIAVASSLILIMELYKLLERR